MSYMKGIAPDCSPSRSWGSPHLPPCTHSCGCRGGRRLQILCKGKCMVVFMCVLQNASQLQGDRVPFYHHLVDIKLGRYWIPLALQIDEFPIRSWVTTKSQLPTGRKWNSYNQKSTGWNGILTTKSQLPCTVNPKSGWLQGVYDPRVF